MTEPSPSAGHIDGRLVYAIGDVHGRYDLLVYLLKQIASDIAARAAGRRPVIIFLGDYIDRGPDSAKVLEALVWLKRDERFEIRLLKGNHEDAFLGSLEDKRASQRWLQVGGRATLQSYGVSLPSDLDDPQTCHQACTDLARRMPSSHLLLVRDLEPMAVIGDYAFVHAGIRPGVPLGDQSLRDLMWIREEFLQQSDPFEKRIVHGHSWTAAQPEILHNRINIDTGAFKTGVLTAVRLQDGELGVFQTPAAAGRSVQDHRAGRQSPMRSGEHTAT